MPPSTTKLAPVTKPDFSRSTRKATTSAISWGFPTRPAGCWVWSLRFSRLYSLVAIQPGLTQLTRMSGPKLVDQPRLRQIEGHDAPAGVEQMMRDGAADTVRRAGDERHRPVRLCYRTRPPRHRLVFRRDRQVRTAAPFGPGAVVERLRRLADGVEREPQRRRG